MCVIKGYLAPARVVDPGAIIGYEKTEATFDCQVSGSATVPLVIHWVGNL